MLKEKKEEEIKDQEEEEGGDWNAQNMGVKCKEISAASDKTGTR